MRNDYPIFNSVKYYSQLSNGINNLQEMHGVQVEIYRIEERESNSFVVSFGTEQTRLKNEQSLKKVCNAFVLSTPQEMYAQYIVGSAEPIKLYLSSATLLQGDIIRYHWVDNEVIEFTIDSLPVNYGNIYFEYTIKSLYQIKE